MTDQSQPAEAAPNPYGSVLRAFGYATSGPILFVGIALAISDADLATGLGAVLGGVLALVFTRLYVATIWAAQLDPRRPPRIPLRAVILYAATGLVLLVLIAREAGIIGYAAIEFLVAWAAGCNRLNDLWVRRLRPEAPEASDVVLNWLAVRAAPHRLLLTRLGYALSFVLLSGGVALHVHRYLGYGRLASAVARCGDACAAPGFDLIAAALAGSAAVLFVLIYATIAEALRYVLVDSWKHVRPGPPPPDLPVWVVALHILIGFVVFFAIGAFVEISPPTQALGHTWLTVEGSDGKVFTLSGTAMSRMAWGWWLGGIGVLKFFWLWRRAQR